MGDDTRMERDAKNRLRMVEIRDRVQEILDETSIIIIIIIGIRTNCQLT